ncbi:MAG: rhomboid family intramembrane serine protease [Candidatus Aureabacteria bacterium]|nr:rhomboid family intramembrane serine protease [Candidatus Auribacterota bacterium]
MRSYQTGDSSTSFHYGFGISHAVKIIIFVNICVFILVHIGKRLGLGFEIILGLVPSFVLRRLMLWQLVTYLFVHIGLWHLVLNMLMFFFFGVPLEELWGRKAFLSFFFFTGIGAGVCSILVSTASGQGQVIVGLSGVIFGLLVAHAVLFPDSIILLFFLFPMKMKHAVWLFIGINILGMLSSPGSGVAYMAHLGGGLFGYLYFRFEWIRSVLSRTDLSSLKDKWRKHHRERNMRKRQDVEEKADRILDKISREGIHSLTKREREILDKRSRMK